MFRVGRTLANTQRNFPIQKVDCIKIIKLVKEMFSYRIECHTVIKTDVSCDFFSSYDINSNAEIEIKID